MDPLSALPVDIFYAICDYLLDAEVLGLRLVSSSIKPKISHQRLRRIHSVKSYFFCHKSLLKLEGLSNQPKHAELVTHLKFDFTRPYVYLQELQDEINQRFPVKIGKCHCPVQCAHRLQFVPVDPRARYISSFCALYTTEHIYQNVAGGTGSAWDLISRGLLQIVIEALAKLPNLKILELHCSDFQIRPGEHDTLEARAYIREWKEHNPEVAEIFDSKEGVELNLDIVSFIRAVDRNTYYPVFWYLLLALVKAQRSVSEIRVSPVLRSRTLRNNGFETEFMSMKEPYSKIVVEEEELGILRGLQKLDFHISYKDWARNQRWKQPSTLCWNLLKNVRDLDLSMDHTAVESSRPSFIINPEMILPCLERLTIRTAYVEICYLQQFLVLNKLSLRKFKAHWDSFTGRETTRDEIIDFLKVMREEMRFSEFDLELPMLEKPPRGISAKIGDTIVLNIQVIGDWIGSDYTVFETRKIFVPEDGDRMLEPHSRSMFWGDFIRAVSGFEAAEQRTAYCDIDL